MKLFIHRSVKIHQHFAGSDCLENAIFIIIVHFEYFSKFVTELPGQFETSLSAEEPSVLDFGDFIIE
jgi:hypothetical protein